MLHFEIFLLAECQDLATQMIDTGVSLIPFSITTNTRDTRDSLQSVLRIAELQGETRIIICSPKDKHERLIRDVLLEVSWMGVECYLNVCTVAVNLVTKISIFQQNIKGHFFPHL